VRANVAQAGLGTLALFGSMALLAGAAGGLLARNSNGAAAALGLGWAGLYLSLALAWPRIALAQDVHELAGAAQAAASPASARIVGYRAYLQGFPWRLGKVLPVVDFRGELEDWWLPEESRREIFWPRGRFWKEWGSASPLVALVRARDREDFRNASPPARELACRWKYCVLANF
jgi:hypothetical protein